ncbi:MAG: OmpH family outer membrane protein, partial [Bacteroidales bacterium]|nr:OmpH family outer membrane protein [Bacteroidales bacterium]
MKKYMKIVLVTALLLAGANVFAQNYKFGHINTNELFALMPERDSAQQILQNFAKELEDQLETMRVELNNKYNDYVNEQENLTDLIKQTKEQEINDLDQRIRGFETTAQQELQRKEAELFQPIYEKANNAIQEVAKENKFTYVFDLASRSLIYFSEDSENILPLVKKKLGIE